MFMPWIVDGGFHLFSGSANTTIFAKIGKVRETLPRLRKIICS